MHFFSTTPFYIADGQQQKGPIPKHELEAMLTSGQILPSTLCWTEGMTGWQPVQSVLPPPAAPPPPLSEPESAPAPEYNPYAPPRATPDDIWNRPRPQKVYGGIRRLPYFALSFVVGALQNGLASAVGDENPAFWLIMLGGIIASFWIIGQRLKNMGASPWWCLLSVVPIANIILGFRCLVNQEGYMETKTLDQAGRTTAWILAGLFVMLIVGIVLAISSGSLTP